MICVYDFDKTAKRSKEVRKAITENLLTTAQPDNFLKRIIAEDLVSKIHTRNKKDKVQIGKNCLPL